MKFLQFLSVFHSVPPVKNPPIAYILFMFKNSYKRPFPGCPEGLEKYYNLKDVGFIKFSDNLDDLADETIIGILRDTYKAYTPMYKFLLSVSDEYFSKEE